MTSDTRSPDEIEREIERERAGLTNTLDDLQGRFSVETITRQVSDQFREHGGEIGRSVTDAVKRNPVALTVTGIGLAWLMLGNRSSNNDCDDRDYDQFRRRSRASGDYDDRIRDSRLYDDDYTDYKRRARPAARSMGPQPGDPTKGYYSGAKTYASNTPSWAHDASNDDENGVRENLRETAGHVADRTSSAASQASDTANRAKAAVADKAKAGADAASDAGQTVRDRAHELTSAASERATALRKRLEEGTADLSEAARERVISARMYAMQARDSAAQTARQSREKAADMFEEHPMIAGALALALGAAVGATLSRSRTEDAYFGSQSDYLMDEAERVFHEEKSKLANVVQAATDEAKQVAQDAKVSANGVAETAASKAKASGGRVLKAAETEAKNQKLGDVPKS